ncbi:MAG: periplasmic heavy metal sensor [Gammaproteobacteria bacterium]|nr:periplasmic heavy metal sensor [Gammaproteobacteria bacterium]
MKKKRTGSFLLISVLTLTSPVLVADEKPHGMDAHKKGMAKDHHSEMKKGHHGGNKHHKGHTKKKGHNFSPSWAKTLSDEQRVAVDKMHLKLDSQLAVLKAQAELLQKELNVITAQNNAKQSSIHSKIDELMTLKAKIMKLRYEHLAEMRAALTEQQRLSYDMAILQREGAH